MGATSTWKSWSFVALIAALAAIAGAAFLSHQWGDNGFDPLYLVAFLAVLGLSFEGTRRWLARATNVKLPGIEVVRQVEDAVAEAADLPDIDEEEDEAAGKRRLRILDSEWWKEPDAALEKLRSELLKRLTWIEKELFAGNPRKPSALISRLEDERLIRRFEARIGGAVLETPGSVIGRELTGGNDRRDVAVKFMERADAVVYQFRLIAFDSAVRQGLMDRGMRILDIRKQPKGRWPDFYAFDADLEKATLRVVVRVARTKHSDLIANARARLQRTYPETPLDPLARRIIVFPQTSRTKPEDDPIPALKRKDFFAWIDAGMPSEETLDSAETD